MVQMTLEVGIYQNGFNGIYPILRYLTIYY